MIIKDVRHLFGSLVQSTVTAFVIVVMISNLKTYLGGASLNPDHEHCANLTITFNNREFQSLASFYPYYLCEHNQSKTKIFHFVGTFNALLIFISLARRAKLDVSSLIFFIVSLVQGYGFAWVSHFFIEENKPATFYYPVYSFMCDWIMFKDMILGNLDF